MASCLDGDHNSLDFFAYVCYNYCSDTPYVFRKYHEYYNLGGFSMKKHKALSLLTIVVLLIAVLTGCEK